MGRKLIEFANYCSYDDIDEWENDWTNVMEHLTTVMRKKNKHDNWQVDVKDFGWACKNGYKYVKADKGAVLINSILPNTECSFKIYNWGSDGLLIQNFHHDSCTGKEIYCVRPKKRKYVKHINRDNG